MTRCVKRKAKSVKRIFQKCIFQKCIYLCEMYSTCVSSKRCEFIVKKKKKKKKKDEARALHFFCEQTTGKPIVILRAKLFQYFQF